MADNFQVRRPRNNQFAQEPQIKVGRSQFNRSHGLKTTFYASYLFPILVDEVLPGDTFTMRLEGFCRVFSPLDAPIMDNIELETFFFFVPNRLLWENWEYFMGAHDAAGAQDTDYTIPVLTGGASTHSGTPSANPASLLMAHMGIPHLADPDDNDISALPFRAYNLIWNEWFRDQNLTDEATVNVDNGPDDKGDFPIKKSGKKHDYFTSCLPYLQKGDASVITSDETVFDVFADEVFGNPLKIDDASGNPQDLNASTAILQMQNTNTGTSLQVDLSGFEISINALRESVAIQRLLERDARGGTRYVELIKSHFGVTSPDYRLQRPEYLGGGKSFINVSPVANTSATATEDQGELRGVGTGRISGHGWAKSFVEHGYIIGLIRARGDLTYFQGLDRMWSRQTRYDFYVPALANLGEQAVLNKEIFVAGTSADDNVFGYQERWAEYRYKPSRIAGKLNPDCTGALSHWHLAEDFSSCPSLNTTFISDATPMTRVTTVTTEPDFIADILFDYKCARPIPVHSIPSLMGGRF